MRVDRDYPLLLIEALEQTHPHAHVGLCSAAGADRPRGHYLQAKASVEQRLLASGLSTVIARPSFLISDRKEFRVLERIALPVFNAVFGLLKMLLPHSSLAWKYAPVSVDKVAERLLTKTLDETAPQRVLLEGKNLFRAD